MQSISMEPIGVIHSPFKTKFGTPRQPHLVPSASMTIELTPSPTMNGCLEGLASFSHLWVIYHFHQNTNLQNRGKVHPPRLAGKTIGVYATRSPHRPNSIGLSVVKIEKIEGWTITVSGGDFVDGTPVLDIKPYIVEVDRVDASAGWLASTEWKPLQVIFASSAIDSLKQIAKSDQFEYLKQLIIETLAQDPRPTVYRDDLEKKYRETHAVYIDNFDVHFEITGEVATVLEIRRAQS